MSRDYMLHKVRTAIGRSAGQPPAPPPPVVLRSPPMENLVKTFLSAVESVAGKAYHASSREDARAYVERLSEGKTTIVSRSRYLAECGLEATAYNSPRELRELCANADLGVTSADYALADTGTLVTIASPEEARMISLLPPVHLAIVPRERILSGLDEFFSIVPLPANRSSSVVFITGGSRTADIEMILVRGVHGPGEIHVVVV
jgi:L-lactate dehydrogenase complex protein LldG